jgi:hypothetical protein
LPGKEPGEDRGRMSMSGKGLDEFVREGTVLGLELVLLRDSLVDCGADGSDHTGLASVACRVLALGVEALATLFDHPLSDALDAKGMVQELHRPVLYLWEGTAEWLADVEELMGARVDELDHGIAPHGRGVDPYAMQECGSAYQSVETALTAWTRAQPHLGKRSWDPVPRARATEAANRVERELPLLIERLSAADRSAALAGSSPFGRALSCSRARWDGVVWSAFGQIDAVLRTLAARERTLEKAILA